MVATSSVRPQHGIVSALVLVCSLLLLLIPQLGRGEAPSPAENLFRQIDANGDNRLTMDEAKAGNRAFLQRMFKTAGKQPSDALSLEEFMAAYGRQHNGGQAGQTAKAAPGASSASEPTHDPKADGSGELKFADADGNGTISRSEWSKFRQVFSRWDTDKDNALAASELEPAGEAAELLMKLADANGDESISRVEWMQMAQSFSRLDANRDNFLELAELEQVAEAASKAAKGEASLAADSKSRAPSGPVLWRGRIDGRGAVELVIEGNRIVGREGPGGNSLGAGTFTMSGDGKSGNMDAAYTEGPQSGQVCLGIYQLNGDTLLWCVNNRGGRPTSFATGGGNWLMTLTRAGDSSTSQ